ncbi:hypothetical protein E4191_11035 [Paracoccus liaowanqingii]|uniref:Uncharacterized protein n=1 Tax=Paracoccus liaowanqingii TaxID=2560053 RepID=A0A4P7HLQ3_9RHOB|nr:hypothetical protein [Paracoccus liaowanqingii]QBX35169.1 hypothetical protein E4191_11035 [Paracoccus liaowanqingii]
MTMIQIDKLTITVTVEGDADAGERAFALLFDKFNRLRDERLAQRTEQSATLARDRSLNPRGGRH